MAKSSAADPEKNSTEDDILELAKKELLRDIKCAAMRAEQFGAHSWAKPQKYTPSKRFLKSMIMHSSSYNERKTRQAEEASLISLEQMASSLCETTYSKKSGFYHSHSRSERERRKRKKSRWDDQSPETKEAKSPRKVDGHKKSHKHKKHK